MTPGRKPNNQPTLAWDRRRYIALVQVIAAAQSPADILDLCELWGVEPESLKEDGRLDEWFTIRALARHAIEYHRADEEHVASFTSDMPNTDGERVCDICGGHVGTECQCDERSYDEEG